ncbi:UNVERIFIED_CONTAM: hypothetical protein GTU68_051433 [Idotea baltica]|nr:hypothetical protein [Idotea baltica]
MTPVFLSSSQIFASGGEVSGRESIYDISKNLERFVDIILARVFSHSVIEEVSSNVKIPVINALCDLHHPTQALADLMCIRWHNKDNKKIKVAYVGDGNNVANSLVQILAKSGIDVAVATPPSYEIPSKELEIAKSFAEQNNSKIEVTNSPIEAVSNADFIYTDTFISMGQEEEKEKRLNEFKEFQVNLELIKNAKPNVKFMHCLPAHRGEEVTDEIMDSKNSIVFDQAECRMHIAKSLFWFFFEYLIENNN